MKSTARLTALRRQKKELLAKLRAKRSGPRLNIVNLIRADMAAAVVLLE